MIIAGIDYSLTSPGICIHTGKDWSYQNCKFYFFFKKEIEHPQYISTKYPEYEHDLDRFSKLSTWALANCHDSDKVFLEGYSFGSTGGRLFQIAENGGLLKFSLWQQGKLPTLFAPSEVKKFATGKGNTNKQGMYDAFLSETGVDIHGLLGIKYSNKGIGSPISDIVDAYYIAKKGHEKETKNANPTC